MSIDRTPAGVVQRIPPEKTTRVVGTDIEVWHDAGNPQVVTVLADGAVTLPQGAYWIVKVVTG